MCERTQVVSDRKLIDHQRIIKSSVSRELLSPGKAHSYQPACPGAFHSSSATLEPTFAVNYPTKGDYGAPRVLRMLASILISEQHLSTCLIRKARYRGSSRTERPLLTVA